MVGEVRDRGQRGVHQREVHETYGPVGWGPRELMIAVRNEHGVNVPRREMGVVGDTAITRMLD